jgi:tetratricopeptide (TPR) repeat protein
MPFLYISRSSKKLVEDLDKLPTYQPIHVWGTVRAIAEGYPWIEVTHFKQIPEKAYTVDVLRDFELGCRSLDAKDPVTAIKAFDSAVAKNPPPAGLREAYVGLGKAYFDLRRYDWARESFAEAVRMDPSDDAVLVLFARTSLRLEKQISETLREPDAAHIATVPSPEVQALRALRAKLIAEAVEAAEKALATDGSDVAARAERALALALSGKVREGLADLEVAERLTGQRRLPEIHRNRALIYARGGDNESARVELEKAIFIRATDLDYHLELGDVLLDLGAADKAEKEYQTTAQLAPQRPEPHLKMALACRALAAQAAKEQKNEEAEGFLQQAAAHLAAARLRDDRFGVAYVEEAKLHLAQGKRAEAAAVLSALVAAASGARSVELQDALFEVAVLLRDQKAMELAAMAGVRLRPQSAERHLRLGRLLESKTNPDYKAAQAEYEVAANLAPAHDHVLAALGRVRLNGTKEWRGAEAALVNAVTVNPNNVEAWSDLAFVRRHLGDQKGALQAAEKAFILRDAPETRVALALNLLDRKKGGDVAQALALAKLTAENEETGLAQAVTGAALSAAGRFTEARVALEKAYKAFPADAEYSLWRGQAHLGVGELAVAESAFRKSLKLAEADKSGSSLIRQVAKAARNGLSEVKKNVKAKLETAVESETDGTRAQVADDAQPLNAPPVIEETLTSLNISE